MYFVYALRSYNHNYIYVGLTSDLKKRIDAHNRGYERPPNLTGPLN
jgi:predicted GIY-YIG superfamily endonuclease